MSGDNLSLALGRLTLADVWELAPRPDVAPQRGGIVKVNPFREDRNPSFSVTQDLKVFCDHARPEVKGGVWKFVALAQPQWSKAEVARWIIIKAGLDPDDKPAKKSRRRGPVVVRQAVEQRPPEPRASWTVWPEGVAERWREGSEFLLGNEPRRAAIAAKRGWPRSVVDHLAELGVIAYPRLPWTDDKRGTAFLVQAPRRGPVDTVSLVSTGYHQRWWKPAKDGRPAEKSWLYLPSDKPEADRADWPVRFPAQRTLPLPFVLGDVPRAKLLVILEGQWDAITFFHAIGGFADSFALPVAVFGIRGAQGVGPFFDFYADCWPWKPAAWVIRDADAAGGAWAPASSWLPGSSFSERLKATMCSRVVVSALKDGAGLGKDFNDYWRAKPVGPDEIAAMMQRHGLLDNGDERRSPERPAVPSVPHTTENPQW